MQQKIREEIKRRLKKEAVFSYGLEAICVLTDLIMYYAAGLTLNTLFAGIGNAYVSMIAFFSSAGAAVGKVLFTSMRTSVERNIREMIMDLPDELIEETENEEIPDDLYRLFNDTAHFEISGILKSRRILIRDCLYAAAVCMLDLKCGVLAVSALIINGVLLNHFAKRNIRSAAKFRLETALASFLPSMAVLSVLMISALSGLKNGRLGIYGTVMIMLMLMDLFKAHAKQNEELLSLRKDLRSAEKIEKYLNEGKTAAFTSETETEKKPQAYLFLAAAEISASALFVLVSYGILNILSYRTAVSLTAVYACVPAAGLTAVLCYGAYLYCLNEKESSGMHVKAVSVILSLIMLIYAFTVNPLLAGIMASGIIALEAALPILIRMRSEDDEERTAGEHEGLYGLVCYVFLILVVAAGIMMYWNSLASFTEVLKITVLYMCAYMHIDCIRSEKTDTDEEDDHEQ